MIVFGPQVLPQHTIKWETSGKLRVKSHHRLKQNQTGEKGGLRINRFLS